MIHVHVEAERNTRTATGNNPFQVWKIKLKFTQNQAENFHFSLEFLVLYNDNTSESKTLVFNDKESNLEWATTKRVSSLRLDPNFKLLFEEKK